MKYTYKSILKTLLHEYKTTKTQEIELPNLSELYITNNDVAESFRLLKDFCLIDYKKDINGTPYDIYLTAKGITFFNDRKNEKIQFWIPVIISFLALLKSFDKEILWLSKQIMQILK